MQKTNMINGMVCVLALTFGMGNLNAQIGNLGKNLKEKASNAASKAVAGKVSVEKIPQKQHPRSASMKKAAPELYGSPNTLTNSRST